MSHVYQAFRLEHVELPILREKISVLKKICGEELVLLKQVLETLNLQFCFLIDL